MNKEDRSAVLLDERFIQSQLQEQAIMKFTEKMQSAINEQIALEMFSANLYLSMSAHYASAGLDGFAHWYYVQYREELGHAEDMM